MSTQFTECPNCSTKLKSGVFSSVEIYSANKIGIINLYADRKAEAYCTKCGENPLKAAAEKLISEKQTLNALVRELIEAIPVITINVPINWECEILGLVTGQSTTGTGVISEFTSSITDVFGMQSGRYNKKLKDGESICLAQLRRQALDMGGNAVIGTDIDYSEVGGEKGMLMVCMAGTAINLINREVLGLDKVKNIVKLTTSYQRLKILNSFNLAE